MDFYQKCPQIATAINSKYKTNRIFKLEMDIFPLLVPEKLNEQFEIHVTHFTYHILLLCPLNIFIVHIRLSPRAVELISFESSSFWYFSTQYFYITKFIFPQPNILTKTRNSSICLIWLYCCLCFCSIQLENVICKTK